MIHLDYRVQETLQMVTTVLAAGIAPLQQNAENAPMKKNMTNALSVVKMEK